MAVFSRGKLNMKLSVIRGESFILFFCESFPLRLLVSWYREGLASKVFVCEKKPKTLQFSKDWQKKTADIPISSKTNWVNLLKAHSIPGKCHHHKGKHYTSPCFTFDKNKRIRSLYELLISYIFIIFPEISLVVRVRVVRSIGL